jgi:hypothetical protein
MADSIPNPQLHAAQPNSPQGFWNRLKPDVRAAILVSPAIILYELLSSLAPVAGYFATFPLALGTYLIQGFLAGRFTKQQVTPVPIRAPGYLRLGALSGIWTSVVVSNAVTLIVLLVATPISLGVFLLGVPPILAASLLDICLNTGISALGAWIFYKIGGKWAVGLSCFVGFLGIVITCSLVTIIALLAASFLSGKVHM